MKIVKKEVLSQTPTARITALEIMAGDIAKKALAGQFVVVMVNQQGERIPLTVVDKDEKQGTITLIFQEVGLTTKLLGQLEVGESLYALAGPLGHATQIKNYGRVILVGGGVGIAEILPLAGAFKKAGNYLATILGARTKDLLILEDKLRNLSDELYIATDDGSYGNKGFTTDILAELLKKQKFDFVYAVGPLPMMEKASLVTKDFGLKTLVSLNPLMVDASGMCGVCRVTVGGQVKFSCVDGPEFDGQLVDWDELSKRNRIYEAKEAHICKLYGAHLRL